MESGPVLWLEGEGQSSLDSAAAAEHAAPQVGQRVLKKRCVCRGRGKAHLFVSVPEPLRWQWAAEDRLFYVVRCVWLWHKKGVRVILSINRLFITSRLTYQD